MNMDHRREKGFIKSIILIIIALALLKYFFNITLKDIADNEVTQNLWIIAKSFFQALWDIIVLLLQFLKELIQTARDFVANLNNK